MTLSLFDKAVDRVLYDSFIGVVGALAGVTWTGRTPT